MLIIESIAISAVLWILAKGEMSNEELVQLLALVFGTLFVTDTFIPALSNRVRKTIGWTIGLKQVGVNIFEGYCSSCGGGKGGGCGCGKH